MTDYKEKYEEYKNSLLQSHWFKNEIYEMYHDSIYAEKNYIDTNGVFWKVGGLSAICGFCIAFLFVAETVTWISWIARVVLFLIISISIQWSFFIEKKFKEATGRANFFAFKYNQYIKKHIQEEKDRETRYLMREIWQACDSVSWRTDSINNMSKEDIEYLLLKHLEEMGAFKKRYGDLDRYDGFISDLINDLDFNYEITKKL